MIFDIPGCQDCQRFRRNFFEHTPKKNLKALKVVGVALTHQMSPRANTNTLEWREFFFRTRGPLAGFSSFEVLGIFLIFSKDFEISLIPMDVYKRIAYLHQVQDLLNQVNRSKLDTSTYKSSDNSNQSLVKLNSFYGFLAKEISMKHNVQT